MLSQSEKPGGVNICSPQEHRRVKLDVAGIVQGVGFRPFIYRLASRLQLKGFTFNHSRGVTIELQGCPQQIAQLIEALRTTLPALARIDSLEQASIPLVADCHRFEIIESESGQDALVAVSADKTCCQDCIEEIKDPDNRHYQYPFTNCTNCGPRYTLIKALPYDRHNTAMASFTMCERCAKAYHDPMDRRYHAQPVSCPDCGPHLSLTTPTGEEVATKMAALQQTVELLRQGKILAIKGLGGFHLVCDATNELAVATLRQRKLRPAKPFAVMCPDLTSAKSYASGSEAEWQMLQSAERPIVLLKGKPRDEQGTDPELRLSPGVAPGIDRLGLFLPYTPLHHLLLNQLQRPIVATSANRSGEPIITRAEAITTQLEGVVDAILDHNRPILNGCDDSVVQLIDDELQIIRLARGYAPLTLPWQNEVKHHTLAVGAQQKNSIAFGVGHNLVLSPHIGDLFSIEAEQYFIDTLATFKRLYQFEPKQLICDMHPEYASSRWAEQYQAQTRSPILRQHLQHHYAHLLSVMAANQYTDKVLGFSFDGTGLGDDNQLWGGEAMLADIQGYRRIASLTPFALIGNEQAIKDPRRIMLALLFARYSLQEVLALKQEASPRLAALDSLPASLIANLHKLWQKSAASHHTSSVGRLFDAIACLLGLMQQTQFEGQAGMLIEAAANRVSAEQLKQSAIELELPLVDGLWQTGVLWQQMVEQLLAPQQPANLCDLLARAFMDCLARSMARLAAQYCDLPVVCCGGVFQNRYLLSCTRRLLQTQQQQVLSPKQVPVNDGGIALGQLWYGIHHQN